MCFLRSCSEKIVFKLLGQTGPYIKCIRYLYEALGTLFHLIAETLLPGLESYMGPCLLIYLQQKAINLQGQGVNGRNIPVFLLSCNVLLGAKERQHFSPPFSLGSLKNGDFMFLWLNKRLNANMESFRNVLSQADSPDRHSITTTFAEVTEWRLVKKTRRKMP